MATQIVGLSEHKSVGEEVGFMRTLGFAPYFRRQVVDVRLEEEKTRAAAVAATFTWLLNELVALCLMLIGRR